MATLYKEVSKRTIWRSRAVKAGTTLLTAGLVALSGFLGWKLLELRADLRVSNAEMGAKIQVLEGQLEIYQAKAELLTIEGERLQNAPSKR